MSSSTERRCTVHREDSEIHHAFYTGGDNYYRVDSSTLLIIISNSEVFIVA